MGVKESIFVLPVFKGSAGANCSQRGRVGPILRTEQPLSGGPELRGRRSQQCVATDTNRDLEFFSLFLSFISLCFCWLVLKLANRLTTSIYLWILSVESKSDFTLQK